MPDPRPAAPTRPAVRLLDRFVLRGTGFPIDLLDRLRFPETAAATATVLAERAALDELASRLGDELSAGVRRHRELGDPATVAALRRFRRAVAAGRAVPTVDLTAVARAGHADPGPADGGLLATLLPAWNTACGRVVAADDEVARIYRDELRRRRVVLRESFLRDDVQEALWLSNPDMVDAHWPSYLRHWQPDRRDSGTKRLERTLYTYLQRFCAKNDTTGFFGPLNYGSFTAAGPAECRLAAERIRRRRGFFAYWAAEAIVRHVQADSAPAAAGFSLDPAGLTPLDDVAAWLRGMPAGAVRDGALPAVEELRRTVERFAAASLPERRELLAAAEQTFAALVGGPAGRPAARRGGDGRMFRDRALLYEECLGDVERLRLTERDREVLGAALAPVARLCAEYARRRTADLRDAGAALLRELGPGGEAVGFPRFAAAWRRRHPAGPGTPSADRLVGALTDLVAGRRGPDDVARLSADDVAELCVTPGDPVVMSPDLMLAAPDFTAVAAGDHRVVIGEIHHGAQPVGWMLCFADDPDAWHRAAEAHLPKPDAVQPANLVLGRRMKVAPPRFAGPDVVVREPVAGAPAGARHPVHGLAALRVVPGPDGPQLWAPDIDRPLRFHAPSHGVGPQYSVFACFSFPLADLPRVRTGDRTPRVDMGTVTVQRRRWAVPADRLPTATATGPSHRLFVACAAFRADRGLPERVFVRSAGEPKPVYVDFTSAFSLEVFARLCADAAGQSPAELLFEEVAPNVDELWLSRSDGRYCSELRTVCSVPGDGAA